MSEKVRREIPDALPAGVGSLIVPTYRIAANGFFR
jgi:hypothetical protein